MTPDELLTAFHAQIRLRDRDAQPGQIVDRDGPVRRSYPEDPTQRGAMIESPEGLDGDPDLWISRQRDFFAGRGQRVEWKTYGYDGPADLGSRLAAHSFVGEDEEALILGDVATLAAEPVLPDGVTLRGIESDDDFVRIAALMDQIWGGDNSWVNNSLAKQHREHPELLEVSIIEEDREGPVLCAAWLRFTPGTEFAGLWGGSTLESWRGRGFYRATVAARATRALDRGYKYLRVDASPDSRPILTRLGLHQVATTTPYNLVD